MSELTFNALSKDTMVATWEGVINTNTGDFRPILLTPGEILELWVTPTGTDLDVWVYSGKHSEPAGLPIVYSENGDLTPEHLTYRSLQTQWVTVQVFPYGSIGAGASFKARATIRSKDYPKPLKSVDIVADDLDTANEWAILLKEAELQANVYSCLGYTGVGQTNLIWVQGSPSDVTKKIIKAKNKPIVASGPDALKLLNYLGAARGAEIDHNQIVNTALFDTGNPGILPISKLYYPIKIKGRIMPLYTRGPGQYAYGLRNVQDQVPGDMFTPVLISEEVGLLCGRLKRDIGFWGALELDDSYTEVYEILIDFLWWMNR